MTTTQPAEKAAPLARAFGQRESMTVGSPGRGRLGWVIRLARDHTALILLVVLVLAGGALSDVFLTPRNLLNIMWAVSILGIVALGQTMLLITCNFDMSVAFVIGLAGIVTVLAQIAGFDLEER
jgi:ribose/xylose/arabinose/galactoside ABC-type transport system permease subunit